MKRLLTYGTFPLVLVASLGGAWLAIQRGVEPIYVVPVATVIVAIVIAILERVHPYRPEWNVSRDDVRTDVIHAVVSMFAIPELFRIATFTLLYAGGAWLTTKVGGTLWPSDWPVLAQLFLGLMIGELGLYWSHRLMHELEPLWRVHAAHHSAPRLYWLNAARFHPIDVLLSHPFHMAPLILLGCPPEVLALDVVFTSVHGMFQHCNINIRLGPLNWIFSMAELHRWHHSQTIEEANHNYGANLIIWDVIFGTRFLPEDREPPVEIGIADMPEFPGGYVDQLMSPFRWKRLPRVDPAEPAAQPAAIDAAPPSELPGAREPEVVLPR